MSNGGKCSRVRSTLLTDLSDNPLTVYRSGGELKREAGCLCPFFHWEVRQAMVEGGRKAGYRFT